MTEEMKIQTPHPDAEAAASSWALMRDTYAGSDAVKAGGTRYLPRPNGMGLAAYGAYLMRGDFFPAVSRSVAGLVGSVVGKPPVVEVPPAARPWLEDVDLADTPFQQFAADTLREALLVGRSALVVDVAGDRPRLVRYKAEDVISWSTDRVEGVEVLTRVVFREEYLDPQFKKSCRYRELFLDEKGWATSREWTRASARELSDPTQEKYVPGESVVLTRRGEPLTFLPVTIFGSQSIGPNVEAPPLEELAHAAVAYYQVATDLRHTLHWVGCPTVVVAGSPWSGADAKDDKLVLGPTVIWRLSQGSTWGVVGLNATAVEPLRNYLLDKKREMAALGARFLDEQPAVAETATAALMRHSGEHATLRSVATVVEAALESSLATALWWGGLDGAVNVEFNKDFAAMRLTPAEALALLTSWQAGAISYTTYYHNLSRGGVMREGITADEEQRAIESESDSNPPEPAGDVIPGITEE